LELGEETFESGWSKHWDLHLTCGGNMAFGIGTLSSFHVPTPLILINNPPHITHLLKIIMKKKEKLTQITEIIFL